jgi:hypothetical protein
VKFVQSRFPAAGDALEKAVMKQASAATIDYHFHKMMVVTPMTIGDYHSVGDDIEQRRCNFSQIVPVKGCINRIT